MSDTDESQSCAQRQPAGTAASGGVDADRKGGPSPEGYGSLGDGPRYKLSSGYLSLVAPGHKEV